MLKWQFKDQDLQKLSDNLFHAIERTKAFVMLGTRMRFSMFSLYVRASHHSYTSWMLIKQLEYSPSYEMLLAVEISNEGLSLRQFSNKLIHPSITTNSHIIAHEYSMLSLLMHKDVYYLWQRTFNDKQLFEVWFFTGFNFQHVSTIFYFLIQLAISKTQRFFWA